MKNYSFFKCYALSKTLRFSLIPEGETLEHIKESGILEQDEHRAESYEEVKKLIDEYHKAYIEQQLSSFRFKYQSDGDMDSLEDYWLYYQIGNKTPEQKDKFEGVKHKLRKQISTCLKSGEAYKRIDKKELIREDLLEFVKTEEDKNLVKEFSNFTTYFTGFYENRRNMYTDEPKSVSIPYRLVDENLPKFIDNISVFDKVKSVSLFDSIYDFHKDMEEYLDVIDVPKMFNLEYYSHVLTQSQIDLYNAVIGGKVLDNGVKIKGLNEYINLYNQQKKDRHERLPLFKPLYKQILSDRSVISWLPEKFTTDSEVIDAVKSCYNYLSENVICNEQHKLGRLLSDFSDYDLSKVYIVNDQQLTAISQKVYGNWAAVQSAYEDYFRKNNPKRKKESDEKYDERTKAYFKNMSMLSVEDIEEKMVVFGNAEKGLLVKHFASRGANYGPGGDNVDLITVINNNYKTIEDVLNVPYPSEKNLLQDKDTVGKIKTLLDSLKELQHFVKPLLVKDSAEKDERFYGDFVPQWEELDRITALYNKVRNYVTRKPYSVEKIKLNFENSTLLHGWDENKERDNTAVILRKDGLYYLGIMNKRHNKIFDVDNLPSEGPCYEKMVYKLLPGPNKMLPKVFFSKSRIGEFAPDEEVNRIYESGTYKKGPSFNIKDCRILIDFFKSSIQKHEDWKKFNFKFSETSSYNDISDFYKEVEKQGYKLTFRNVSVSYIDRMVSEGKLYLFKIYNKDFSPYSKGTPNIHTIYWRMLFDERNLADVVYCLNGQAEVFFRKSSIKCTKPTHPAGQPILNKRIGYSKQESVFEYDIIKDKRYTVDHFQLHVPITLNFKNEGINNINSQVCDFIKDSKEPFIIGIDRGERNLLYFTMIDKKGRIVPSMQYSLNVIDSTDYHQLLARREDERLRSRQSWQTIEGIKDLKEGYLSMAVHRIAELMVKYRAIVVLEDLNSGFMRGRQKVERQVYQKFERMLIEKLNYLVEKKRDVNELGGALNALQLTNKFESFQRIGKQCGFLFYVPAWNTSKIDPVTGFVNLFDTKYESVEKSKAFFDKFDEIRYNAGKDWIEFVCDYSKFTYKADGTREKWTICTYGDRIYTFRNIENNSMWDSRELVLVDEFKRLFVEYGIDVNDDIKAQILRQNDKAFFYNDDNAKSLGLMQLFRLTVQMRNSIPNTSVDYIISPVANEDGIFYDSRKASSDLPQDADANGAYNIARKGLWVIEQIRQCDDYKKLKLAISNKEWLGYVQDKPYLND